MGKKARSKSRELRVLTLGLALALIWSSVGLKLWDLQVVQAADLKESALEQTLRTQDLEATRGTIFDRTGQILAFTIDSDSIYATPFDIEDPMGTSLVLSAALGLPLDQVLAAIQKDTGFVWLKRHLELEEAAAVAALDLPGIHAVVEPKRVYPMGVNVAHTVGFVDPDGTGIEGIEYQYNDLLAGRAGFIQEEWGKNNVPIPQSEVDTVPAVPGADLITSIDLSIALVAREACEAALVRTGGLRCSVVVMDPRSGEILAMETGPSFDPEDVGNADPLTLQNMSVRYLYEPGSIMKAVTVSAAIEEGAVNPNTWLEVPTSIDLDEFTIRDTGRDETESMQVRSIITRSSNVGTILIQQELGDELHRQYLYRFGFGQPTGVDISGEAIGQLNVDATCSTCLPSAAIGYAVNTTLLQMASVYATIANNGIWVQPHLVREIVTAGESMPFVPERREVISSATAATVRLLLQSVVESDQGTGRNAAIEGYSVGGKTGTTRVYDGGKYHEDRHIASFVGMAPINDPRLVIAVMVQEPINGYFGSQAAAPVFAEVMRAALLDLGVQPDE